MLIRTREGATTFLSMDRFRHMWRLGREYFSEGEKRRPEMRLRFAG